MGWFLSTCSSFFFIFAKWRSCFLSFWFLILCRLFPTVTIQWEGKCLPSKVPEALPMKSCFRWEFWSSDLVLKHLSWFLPAFMGSGLCGLLHPSALLCSLHFYHLWSSHGQRTPSFISNRVLLPHIANPWPICSHNFSAARSYPALHPLPPQCLYLLVVRLWGSRERKKWIYRLAFASCLVWLV